MDRNRSFKDSKVIRSSEISLYTYCPYYWWECRNGKSEETEEMRKGVQFHEDFMAKKDVAIWLHVASFGVIAAIIILAVIYLLMQ